ncbi:MAG: 5-(carboxyamino)imidazole ribonucleotide synthase [Alphaproteobacteria bacterium]|nr:5-(carboxyamino)imidazole ribonucleotide synthase [Alphaproteobacteria bacterium]
MGTRRLPPNATIGIFGGGQLGRMTALAAARLGYRCHIFAPEDDVPASQVSAETTRATYDDATALQAFARAVDVVTLEFENIPVEAVRRVNEITPVYPGANILETCQDRVREKEFLNRVRVATTPWAEVPDLATLEEAAATIGWPAVLKSARFGYDGKGQVTVRSGDDLSEALKSAGAARCILEGFVDFACEISVIVARGADGAVASWPAVENRHIHHILDTTIAPAQVSPAVAAEAEEVARRIAAEIGLVGVMGVEMFVTRDDRVLVNELAPRPHNSGHWTIDACDTSQFEQLVRIVCGLPLGATTRHSDAVMKNLIGDEVDAWPRILAEPGARLHLYGKAETRPGRKMGHVTRLTPSRDRGNRVQLPYERENDLIIRQARDRN